MYRPKTGLNSQQPHQADQVSASNDKSRCRKNIISRQQFEDGRTIFLVGLRSSAIIDSKPQQVSLSNILDHVTPKELERYENQEFLSEDKYLSSLLPPKPKGRPRKILGVSRTPLIEEPVHAGLLNHTKQPWTPSRKFAVVVPISSPVPNQTAVRLPMQSKPQNFAGLVPSISSSPSIVVGRPSFDGPRPVEPATSPVSEIATSEHQASDQILRKQPRYPMLAASGLLPSESSSEADTSRDVSLSRSKSLELSTFDEPIAKRRKYELSNNRRYHANSPHRQLNGGLYHAAASPTRQPYGSSPNSSDNHREMQSDSSSEDVDLVDTIDVRDEEEERAALLRQFQTSNGSPRNPEVSLQETNTPPHWTFTSSSLTPLNTQKASLLAQNILAKANAQPNMPDHVSTPSERAQTLHRIAQDRASLTPHFPRKVRHASVTSQGSVTDDDPIQFDTIQDAPQIKASPTSHVAKGMSYSSRILQSMASEKRKHLAVSSERNNFPPIAKANTSATNGRSALDRSSSNSFKPRASGQTRPTPTTNQPNMGAKISVPASQKTSIPLKTKSHQPQILKNIQHTSDITQYFRPKSKPSKVLPIAASKTESRSESESESIDPLVRASPRGSKTLLTKQRPFAQDIIIPETQYPSESDSLKSKITLDRRRSRQSTPRNILTTANQGEIEIPDSEDDKQRIDTINVRNHRASFPAQGTALPSRPSQKSIEAENTSEEENDDDDDISDASSEEVVVRKRRPISVYHGRRG